MDLNKFYTHPEIAKLVVDEAKEFIEPYGKIMEPSAGSGNILNYLYGLNKDVHAIDISPDNKDIIKQDFLTLSGNFSDNIVIGNPPFGENGKMCFNFINKCLELKIKTIGFILPKTFLKANIQKKIGYSKLLYNLELPKYSFLLNGVPHDVPTVFQIWTNDSIFNSKKNLKIEYKTTNKNKFFEIVSKGQPANIFIFGASGKLISPSEVTKNNRGYYLRFSKDGVQSMLASMDWKKYGKSSVSGGVFWLTKQEILEYFELEYLIP